MIHVENSRCPENHPCPLVRRCPVGAITQEGYKAPVIDEGKCVECGICTRSCPFQAVSEAVPA